MLATVTTGLCVGWWAPNIMAPETRLRGNAVWAMVVFILNGLVFVLIGLQLSTILATLSGHSLLAQAGLGLLISLVVDPGPSGLGLRNDLPAARALSDPPHNRSGRTLAGDIRHRLGRHARSRVARDRPGSAADDPGARSPDLPDLLRDPGDTGRPGAIVALDIRALRVVDDGAGRAPGAATPGRPPTGGDRAHRTARARVAEPSAADRHPTSAVRPSRLPPHNTGHAADDDSAHDQLGDEAAEQELFEHRLIRREVIDAERAAVLELRRRGEINDEAWRRIERDLDLEELRMEA